VQVFVYTVEPYLFGTLFCFLHCNDMQFFHAEHYYGLHENVVRENMYMVIIKIHAVCGR